LIVAGVAGPRPVIVGDTVEVYRLRKAHPEATVRVDRVN
jgi:hypothetical protein